MTKYPKDDDLDELVNATMARKKQQPPKQYNYGAPAPPPPTPATINPDKGAVKAPRDPSAPLPTMAHGGYIDVNAKPGRRAGVGATTYPGGESFIGEGSGNKAGVYDGDGADAEGGKDDLEDLVNTRHAAEMKARGDDLDHENAKALEASARVAGLGGMGLNGAGVALGADVGRAGVRNRLLALDDLEREQKKSDFKDIQRQAFVDDYEEANGRDVDGDGKIGGVAIVPEDPADLSPGGDNGYDPNDAVESARSEAVATALKNFAASGKTRESLPTGDPAKGVLVMGGTDRDGNPVPGGAVYWDGKRLFRGAA